MTGATVTLWYPGVTGYGSAPTALKTTTTDGFGNFAFAANSYTCPASDMPVYLTLTGGNPGLTSGTNNPYIALMAYIGPCGTAGSQYAWVNEVTTIATVFATAQFSGASQAAGGSGGVGAATIGSVSGTTVANGNNIGAPIGTISSGALTVTNALAYTGLKNAFATVANLANIVTGAAGATNSNATAETAKINSLANILASCVQTDGSTSTVCANLAAVTTGVTPTGHTVPTDTVQIATYMALSPTTNVSTVYSNFTTPQPEFQTALTAAPFDWTVAITFSGLGLAAPQFPAVDAQGNIWIGNAGTPAELVEVTPLGQLAAGAPFLTSGYSGPTGISIDPRGHVWSALKSTSYNAISEFNPSTATQSKYTAQTGCVPSGLTINPNLDVLFSCSTITSPQYPLNAIQNTGTTSVPVYNNGLTNTGTTGSPIYSYSSSSLVGNTSTSGTAAPTTYPTVFASDISGNIWVPEYIAQPNAVTEMVPGTFVSGLPTTYTATTYTATASSGSSPSSMTVDHAGNLLYAASAAANKYTVSTSTNTHATIAGLNGAKYGSLDGAGDFWVANSGSTTVPTSGGTVYFTISEVSNALTAITPGITANVNPGGYTHNYGQPRHVVVDGSGNVWVPNYTSVTTPTATTNQLTEIVGAGVPVYTPLGAAALNNRLGTMP